MNEKDLYRLIVIGPTGAGKSQFCNFIMRDEKNKTFTVSDSLNSCTQDPSSQCFTRLRSKTQYEIIDTAGNSDSSNNDQTNLEKLITFLKEKKTIDYIVLLLAYGQRVTGESRLYLNLLGNIFTTFEFYYHLCVFFTRSPKNPKKKEMQKQKKLIEEINEILKEAFKVPKDVKVPPIRVFFIDTEYDEDEGKYEELFQETVDLMLKYMKLDVFRYNSINTSKLDIKGQRIEEFSIQRSETMKKLSNLIGRQSDLYLEKKNKENLLKKEIETAKKNKDEELVKQKEKELEILQNKNMNELKLDKDSEEKLKILQEQEKKFSELEKKIDEEAKAKNIHVDNLDNVYDKYADISKKLGIGSAASFLLGLGGIAASSICPFAGPIIATFCFTGCGGFTLGSIGYGAAALLNKKNK